jgi:hypothetical protein
VEDKMSGLGHISVEPDTLCAQCGIIDECRPYGKNYEQLCFDCAMMDEETTRKRMDEYIFGEKQNEH